MKAMENMVERAGASLPNAPDQRDSRSTAAASRIIPDDRLVVWSAGDA